MASDPIETAPKTEELIALLDESGGAFEIARWSAEKGNWVGPEGEPIRMKPTHWFRPDPSWLSTTCTLPISPQGKKAPRRKRFGLYAGLLIIAWSAMLEVPWSGGLPIRENIVKIFSTDASVAPQTVAPETVAPQTVASEPVAGADMANLYARTDAESPAGIENTYHPTSIKPSSSADALAGDPGHARERVEAVMGRVADDAASTGQEQALRQERRRIDALARDLAVLRADIEAIRTRLAAAGPAHIEDAESVQRAQASPSQAPQLAASAESSVRKGSGAAVPTGEPAVTAPDDGAAASPVRAIDEQRIALFVRRGEDFMTAGDFVGARVVFRHAAELGDARAALILAATYDPNPLERFRLNGGAAKFAKAPFWYETAMLAVLPSRREDANLWPAVQWPKADVLDGS